MPDAYALLTHPSPHVIDGRDFTAWNYGQRYGNVMQGGARKIVISGNDRSYVAYTPQEDFPRNISFRLEGPYFPASEASHITERITASKIDCGLDELVAELAAHGVRFEGRA